MTYTCIDGFSGAGGLRLGLERSGYEVLLSFDNDPLCIETQNRNGMYFERPAVLAGIDEMLDGRALRMTGLIPGELFLLAGGPPCQGFSVQRMGEDTDERNDLVLKYVSLIDELRPRWFLMENVPGIAGKRGRELLKRAIDKATDIGYFVHRGTLDAQDYGVPQRRRRIILIGERNDHGLSHFSFPNPLTPIGHRIHVREVIEHLPEPPDNGSDHPEHPHHRRDRLSELNKRRLRALLPGQGRSHLPDDLLSNCHRRSADAIGHRNVYGRMSWDDVAPTITAKFDSFSRGMFGHPEQTRTISLREGALLQTFPSDFIFAGSKIEIARQIGNAIPPRFGEVLGAQIIKCHATEHLPSRLALT
jgi:DNA (cytosine-5)-methyltransferase 1